MTDYSSKIVAVKLRKFKASDAKTLALLMNNENVLKNLRDHVPNPYTIADGRDFISLCRKEKPPLTFAIQHDRKLCGVIGFTIREKEILLSSEVGYWIGEPYWNQGIATAALHKMIKYGFDELKFDEITASTFHFNEASRHVLINAGFKERRYEKQGYSKQGEMVDLFHFAISKFEYEHLSVD